MRTKVYLRWTALLWLGTVATFGQSMTSRPHPLASHIVVPQARLTASGLSAVQVREVKVAVDIVEQVATTTMDIHLTNATASRLEAELVLPVPDAAAVRGFTFEGAGSEPTAELLPRDEARRIYESIVAKTRDPALLEFIGYNLIRSSVFPVEARGQQTLRLVYDHVLPADVDRVDYVLPRTESVDYRVPWEISVRIRAKRSIAAVYSPTHGLDVSRNEGSVMAKLSAEAKTEPGPFRLSYLTAERGGVTASLLAYPDPKIGGGYFLLLAAAPLKQTEALRKREVILVIDRSGSMAGEKLEQVRSAALQVIEGLEDGEAFNIIAYNEAVETFSPEPVIKDAETVRAARSYLRRLRVRGGTNIHDALAEALRQRPTPGALPIILFLTDGLPTVGTTSEAAIRKLVSTGNRWDRRVFTFGVGVDVNTPLLEKIALETRARASFVLPTEDVEVKVGQVFRRLAGPVFAGPKLQVLDVDGSPAHGRVTEVIPAKLPDLFEGDQLVLLGQYAGEEPLCFRLAGDHLGRERTFKFQFAVDKATTRNAFVPRLWASRKIAVLTDAIRDLGADGTSAPSSQVKELTDEIVRLSKEFGVLTEYTAFLAREGTDLTRPAETFLEAEDNFIKRALQTRTGYGSVNQSLNSLEQRSQQCLKLRNDYWDANMNRVSVSTVQQVNDRAFYKRGDRWVDSTLLEKAHTSPARIVAFGSEEFSRLLERLAHENRPGCVALSGEILLNLDGEMVLVRY